MRPLRLSVCLFQPLIAQNTGNVGRTCLAFGARLHLIRPLGFELTDKHVKRAGLDYWHQVDVTVHDHWNAFAETELPSVDRLVLYSKRAKHGSDNALTTDLLGEHVCLVFGSEVKGLDPLLDDTAALVPPIEALEQQRTTWAYIPMQPDSTRSLNLSNTVAMACFDALRQNHDAGRSIFPDNL